MAIDPVTAISLLNAAAAVGGGLASLFGKKRGEQATKLGTLTPDQESAQKEVLSQALAGLRDQGSGFDPIAQRARTNFQTQTVPSLAERFTAMGQGAQRSSAFTEALGAAGSGLEEGLAALASQRGLQERGLLQSLLGIGMRPSFETIFKPEQLGGTQRFGASLFGNAMQNIGPLLQLQQLSGGLQRPQMSLSDLFGGMR